MLRPGSLSLSADRYTPFVATLTFEGIDLTGATMKAQVRDRKDGGMIRADLATVTTADTQGLRLLSAGTVDGVLTSVVYMQISASTMAAMPDADPVEDDLSLYWDLHVTPSGGVKGVYLRGAFSVRAGVTQ